MRSLVPVLGTIAALLAGCSETTSGTPSLAHTPAPITGFPSSAATSVPASAPPATTAPATTAGEPPPGTPILPNCLGPPVTADGAPFCYRLPHGFDDFSTQQGYATAWRWRTLVSIGRHDLVEVLGQPTARDFSRLSHAALERVARRYAFRVGTKEIAKITPPAAGRVDGYPSFEQHGSYTNGVRLAVNDVYAGHDEVSISCQYQQDRRAVTRACRSVIATLRIVPG